MWKKNSWTRREDGGEKKHETESEGENCRLYIYSGKTAPKELMILDGEEEKERKRERERGRKDRKEEAEEGTYGLRSNLPSRWDGIARRGSPRGAESSGE